MSETEPAVLTVAVSTFTLEVNQDNQVDPEAQAHALDSAGIDYPRRSR